MIAAVERYFTVLRLARRPDGVTAKEAAEALGVHVTTAYRILDSLEELGEATVQRRGAKIYRATFTTSQA